MLAGWQHLDEHVSLVILVHDEQADIALDPASAKHDNECAHNPARQAAAILQAGGDASEEEDEKADKVDGTDWAAQRHKVQAVPRRWGPRWPWSG